MNKYSWPKPNVSKAIPRDVVVFCSGRFAVVFTVSSYRQVTVVRVGKGKEVGLLDELVDEDSVLIADCEECPEHRRGEGQEGVREVLEWAVQHCALGLPHNIKSDLLSREEAAERGEASTSLPHPGEDSAISAALRGARHSGF